MAAALRTMESCHKDDLVATGMSCPSFPIDRQDACPTKSRLDPGSTSGVTIFDLYGSPARAAVSIGVLISIVVIRNASRHLIWIGGTGFQPVYWDDGQDARRHQAIFSFRDYF